MTDDRLSNFAVRRAFDEDAAEVTGVWWRSRLASTPAIPPPIHTELQVRRWFGAVVLPTRDVWVVESGPGQLIAVMVLDAGWLDQLYVDPDSTGRGIGARLLDQGKALRPDGLDLWTFQSNLGARRFYERHGFVAVESTGGDNEEGAPDVHYHWPGRGS